AEPRPPADRQARDSAVLVAGFGNPVAAAYAAHMGRQGTAGRESGVRLFSPLPRKAGGEGEILSPADVVLFLTSRLAEQDRRELDGLLTRIREQGASFVGVVSSFRAHLGDAGVAAAEEYVLDRLKGSPARVVVFRPGFVLCPGSPAAAGLRRFGPC